MWGAEFTKEGRAKVKGAQQGGRLAATGKRSGELFI